MSKKSCETKLVQMEEATTQSKQEKFKVYVVQSKEEEQKLCDEEGSDKLILIRCY
jgi:hypothetical protein